MGGDEELCLMSHLFVNVANSWLTKFRPLSVIICSGIPNAGKSFFKALIIPQEGCHL